MKLLTGAAILAANDLPHEDVEVPEWGGTVRVWCSKKRRHEEL